MQRYDYIRYRFSEKHRDLFWRFFNGQSDGYEFTTDHLAEKREVFDFDPIFDFIKGEIAKQTWPKDNSYFKVQIKFNAGVVRILNHQNDYFDIPIIKFYRGLV